MSVWIHDLIRRDSYIMMLVIVSAVHGSDRKAKGLHGIADVLHCCSGARCLVSRVDRSNLTDSCFCEREAQTVNQARGTGGLSFDSESVHSGYSCLVENLNERTHTFVSSDVIAVSTSSTLLPKNIFGENAVSHGHHQGAL